MRVPGSAERIAYSAGLTMLGVAAAIALVQPLAFLFRIVSRGYNEGWNAFWAEAATHGDALYVSADSLVSNNYPPISFYVVGLVGQLVGDNIIAGRLVSLASFIVVIAAVYLFMHAAGATRLIALTGAALLAAKFAAYASQYIGMNDPQLLAHAFMLSAVVVLWRFDFSVPAVLAAAALMLLGGFTKHLLIPLPVAVTVWIAMYRRTVLVPWLACFAVGVPLAFWIITSSYPTFFSELMSARVYSFERTLSSTGRIIGRFLPFMVLGAIPLVSALRMPEKSRFSPLMTFVLLYAGLSLVLGSIAMGGEGVTRNAWFDLLIALAIFAALGFEWLLKHAPRAPVPGLTAASAAIVLLGFGMTLAAAAKAPDTLRAVRERDALEQETKVAIGMIGQLGKGRAACETLALCYWARAPFRVDFFNYGQKLRTGALPVADCEATLRRGDFPVLQLELDSARHRRLGPCAPAIDLYYTETYRSPVARLLVPRQRMADR